MGALGGGSSQTVFGGAGAGNVLTRITSVCAALFMLLSATLAYMSSSSDSNLENVGAEIEARQAATIVTEPAAATETAEPQADEAATPEAAEDVAEPVEAPAPGEEPTEAAPTDPAPAE